MIGGLLLAAALTAPPLVKGWSIPVSVGYYRGVTFGLGVGYQFNDRLKLSVQGIAGHADQEKVTRMVDPDDFFLRWQPQPLTMTIPGETKYGGVATLDIKVGKR